MEFRHFEDTGAFYANEDMIQKNIVLSMNTGLVYDIEDIEDVKIIKKVSDTFFVIAQKEIKCEEAYFYLEASIYGDPKDSMCLEY